MQKSTDVQSRLWPFKPAEPAPPSEPAPSALSTAIESLIGEIRHADFARLVEAVELFKRVPRSASGFPAVRPSDCRAVTEALRAYVRQHRTRFAHDDPVVPRRFFELLDQFADSDLRAYPNEVAELDLVRVEALLLAGRHQEALALVGPKAERPYQIEDNFSLLEKVFALDTLARLNAGRYQEVQQVVLGRVLLLARLRRRAPKKLFDQFFTGLAIGPLFSVQYSIVEVIPRLLARLCLALRLRDSRPGILRFASMIVGHTMAFVAGVFLQIIALRERRLRVQVVANRPEPTAANDSGDVLVTRAMGGIGDITMMTPGLGAMARQLGRPVYFATKRQFFPLLESNPQIRLLDIDQPIDVSRFRRWVNLSICPAGRYEARHVPKVRKGRVELFARAMGVGPRALSRYGWGPTCALSPDRADQRERYRAEFSRSGLPVIGVQPYSRDTYKNAPGLLPAIALLAERAHVVVFHNSRVSVPHHPNVSQIYGLPLQQTLAAIGACDYFVSVDSGFFHVTAAFGIPTLGVFGPTDGKLIARHYRRAAVLGAPASFGCAPCWRSEDRPCQLTGGYTSACMSSLQAEAIVADVERLMRRHPFRTS